MIEPDMRNAIYQLHLAGVPLRQISRQLKVSRNTVRAAVRQQGAMPQTVRKDKIQIDRELLERLYRQCDGWLQRVHEKLLEEEGIQVSYSTLTRLVRELELGKSRKHRCDRVPDEPGVEMQHDTTVYQVKLAGKPTRVIASLLYLRYSKRRYLKFYRVFHRFAMKCFLHEALMFWGCSARQCIIDNTNLARLRGTGKRAVIAGGDGLLRRALRLPLRLPRDRPCKPKSRRGAQFLDRPDQLSAGPQLREPGGPERPGVPVGHGPHGPPPGEQERPGSRQSL